MLSHTAEISIPHATVWEERISQDDSNRSYAIASQPIKPSISSSTWTQELPRSGVSTIKFSNDGMLLATKSESMPTTVWIWSLSSMIAFATLLHHAPVRLMEWHPTVIDLLLLHCGTGVSTIHLWKESWDAPRVIPTPKHISGDKLEASWIHTSCEDPFKILLAAGDEYTILQISHDGEVLELPHPQVTTIDTLGPDDRFDEGHSMDFSAVKLPDNTTAQLAAQAHDDTWALADDVDDTFHFKHHTPTVVSG